MLICVNVVQVCDARDDDSSNAVDYIKKCCPKRQHFNYIKLSWAYTA